MLAPRLPPLDPLDHSASAQASAAVLQAATLARVKRARSGAHSRISYNWEKASRCGERETNYLVEPPIGAKYAQRVFGCSRSIIKHSTCKSLAGQRCPFVSPTPPSSWPSLSAVARNPRVEALAVWKCAVKVAGMSAPSKRKGRPRARDAASIRLLKYLER